MKNIVIMGAGMAGFGASHALNKENVKSVIFEKLSHHGGMASSFTIDGYTFDTGPHISFTKDEQIQQLWAESVKNEYETLDVSVNNFWKGHWIKHPAQVNLNNLPVDMVVKIVKEFIDNKSKTKENIVSFKDWLYASFGPTFAETFPMKYGEKFHTTTADNMSIDWLGPRLYEPKIEEVLYGALTSETKDVHYISNFRYPKHGGYVSYLNSFQAESDVRLNHEVTSINTETKEIEVEDKGKYAYDHLISSLPLPELIPIIKNVPAEVIEASKKLSCSTCVIVNLGIGRSDISKNVWTYFYDKEIVFTRLSFPHMQAKSNVPEGCGSVQAEIYFSKKYKPLKRSADDFIQETITDLIKCGLFREDDEILYKEAKILPYANVIFDHERKDNLEIVHNYLEDVGIKYCGRYGEWRYIWTDESFKSGMNAASKILKEIN